MKDLSEGKKHIGILLTNLGTPDSPTPSSLRKYLAEFLSDRRVIDKPAWLWNMVLYGIILNIRPARAAKAYRSIWTDEGSPLMKISKQQSAALGKKLAANNNPPVTLKLAMRYGNPSISQGIDELIKLKVDRIIVLPLYPQFSATTTASTYDAVLGALKNHRDIPEIDLLGAYHNHELYIEALANSIFDHWKKNGRSERLLFSFHGLPLSYIKAGDPYRKQCLDTVSLLARRLNLTGHDWLCAFQSRFGVEEWVQPYADKTLESWGQNGIKSVDVICPGFSADCLETLEETAVQNRKLFIEAGGESYSYIPCLNDRGDHITLLQRLIQSRL
ncbi:MAG TPA: ferrochelatase [Gammaproteobacteria bacterium]|nr:ferrochelatase [Gammaproteobacteria bacterium]